MSSAGPTARTGRSIRPRRRWSSRWSPERSIAEFARVTRSARFIDGEGLNGRAWHRRELVHVDDIGELTDCCRAPIARRSGVRAAVCLPILRGGVVIGTMDFFATQALDITRDRLDALRAIARLASDKITALADQLEMVRQTRMLENSPTSMMFADRDLKIRYMNPATFTLLKRIEAYLPCKAEEMIGRSIDMFHRDPEHQRRLLADPKNLPHRALIQVGPEHADLLVNAILDKSGNYLGPMLTWDIVTEKLRGRGARGRDGRRHRRRQPAPAEDGPGRHGTRGRLVGTGSHPRVVRLDLRGLLGGRPRRDRSCGSWRESGSVAEEFRRSNQGARFREGEGLLGRTWQAREMVVMTDLAESNENCPRRGRPEGGAERRPSACRSSSTAQVDGAIDFVSEHKLELSEHRQETLRSVGRMISTRLERVRSPVGSRAGEAGHGAEGQPAHEGRPGRRRGAT